MSVMLISVSQDTVVSNKHEEQTRHYYVIFQQTGQVSTVRPHSTDRVNPHLTRLIVAQVCHVTFNGPS